ncbi:MAG: hypothetical protein HY331_02790 [Chloroflexi bacterium]|nr:hypothetical protein [Chloroflexota bacterium]
MGVIDTLTAGFGAINRRPWMILLPVALDLFLWLGPRLTAGVVFRQALTAMQRFQVSTDTARQVGELTDSLSAANVFALLAWQLPSLAGSHSAQLADVLPGRAVVTLQSGGLLILVMVALALAGLAAASAYLTALAIVLRGEDLTPVRFLVGWQTNFGRLVGYLLLLAGGLLVFGTPAAIVLALAQVLSPALAGILWMVVVAAGIWLWLYLFFVTFAIFVGGHGPLKAVERSVRLVAGHFWPAFGIFALIQLITVGTTIAWGLLLPNAVGALIAIVGNAYVLTGLTAGAMLFYRDRSEATARVTR